MRGQPRGATVWWTVARETNRCADYDDGVRNAPVVMASLTTRARG
jgi:hypothetical protein